jgi:hypothetical protein
MILVFTVIPLSAQQRKAPIVVGFNPPNYGSPVTWALSTAAKWLQLGFVPSDTATGSKLKAYCSSVTGTLAATDLRLEILKDINGTATAAVTVQDTGDTVTITAPTILNTDVVRFTTTANGITGSDATPPVDIDYYVCNRSGTTFQIDATSSACAAIVPITSDGSNYVRDIRDATATVTTTPTGALWVEWTGLTKSLTGGTQYRGILRNMNAVPASNYAAFQTLAQYTWPVAIGLSGSATIANGWSVVWSADAGATWGSGPGFSAIRLEYAGSLFEGIPIQNIAIETTNMVYAAREVGDVFTTPANAIWNVRGACMWMTTKAGTPTGNAQVRLYDGVTLLATTVSTWPAGAAANGWYCGYFSANQVVAGGSTLRVVLSETTQSDTSSNAYRVHQYTIENTAGSLALMPFAGTLQMTYTTDSTASPVVFTETATKIVPFALLLNTDGEFAATSGGGVLGRVVSQ